MTVIANNCPEIYVTLLDTDEEKVSNWNSSDLKNLPVFEPGLSELVQKNRNKNLFFTTDAERSISKADIVFISVNTPTKTKGIGAGYASDLKWVENSARMVSKFAKDHTIVVEKSTVPVRTAELIKEILFNSNLKSKNCSKTFSVLSNPEFLAEGTAIKDLENPDRVLIGGEDKEAIEQLSLIYQKWIPKEKIFVTNLWSSELSKLTANAFLAQRISSINAISSLCEPTGADIQEVAKAIGADKRIGEKFLNAGPGFGGSCFQKDLLNMIYLCRHYGLEEVADYWEQVVILNEWQKKRISKLIIETFFGTVTSKKCALLGFAFKSNTNDTRESSSIQICKDLIEEGAEIFIHDPKVTSKQITKDLGMEQSNKDKIYDGEGRWFFIDDINTEFINADAVVILTEWNDYMKIDWTSAAFLMRKPAWIFDVRSIVNPKEIIKNGFNLWRIGDGTL